MSIKNRYSQAALSAAGFYAEQVNGVLGKWLERLIQGSDLISYRKQEGVLSWPVGCPGAWVP
jgi:hypothetical protein